jgi:hypothetical protein
MRPALECGVETALLAAIHAHAIARAPRIRGMFPARPCPGDPAILVGEGFGGGQLRASFGGVETWAVALSHNAALALVPHDAPASPVVLSRAGLRSNVYAPGEPESDEPARVLRVDPDDGASGVFRDSPVVVRLSHAADVNSVSPATLRVEGPHGTLRGLVGMSPDAQCLIWTGAEPFVPDGLHFVVVRGVVDRRGREVRPHISRFVPCDLVWSALLT